MRRRDEMHTQNLTLGLYVFRDIDERNIRMEGDGAKVDPDVPRAGILGRSPPGPRLT